jgi:peptidoglycan-associated lipoprotein
VKYPFISFFSVALLALIALAGCSSTTANPDLASSRSAKPGTETRAKTTAVNKGSPISSSLEALQRGESTATPASSPLQEIYFEFDRYDLRADARETLKANAGWLKSNPWARIEVEGHADERGTNEYNLALGAKRAQAPKDYLTALGVSAERVSTISYGEEIPVCREHSDGCWQKNRRGRFVIQSVRPTS